jgi:hypothetical protein
MLSRCFDDARSLPAAAQLRHRCARGRSFAVVIINLYVNVVIENAASSALTMRFDLSAIQNKWHSRHPIRGKSAWPVDEENEEAMTMHHSKESFGRQCLMQKNWLDSEFLETGAL